MLQFELIRGPGYRRARKPVVALKRFPSRFNVFCTVATIALLTFSDPSLGRHYGTSKEAKVAAEQYHDQIAEDDRKKQQLATQINELTARLIAFQQHGYDVRDLDQQNAKIGDDIRKLRWDEDSALTEMRQGLFCTGCNRTRSDILAHDGPNAVFPHPGQQVRAATQQELEAKAKTFEDKIADLEVKAGNIRAQRQSIITAFDQEVARQQHALDILRHELLLVDVDEDNARFQLSYANSMITCLERSEGLKAEIERDAELRRAKQEQAQAEHEARLAEQRAKYAAEQAEQAQRESRDRQVLHNASATDQANPELQQLQQNAQELAGLAKDAQARRQAADEHLDSLQVPPSLPFDQLMQRNAPSDSNAAAGDTLAARADQIADEAREQLNKFNSRRHSSGPGLPSGDQASDSALDHLASLGSTDSFEANQSQAGRVLQQLEEKYQQSLDLLQARAGDKLQERVKELPDELLEIPLRFGPETPAQQIEAGVKSFVSDALKEPSGSEADTSGSLLQVVTDQAIDSAKEKAVDYIATRATNYAINSIIRQGDNLIVGKTQEDASVSPEIQEAEQEFYRQVGPTNLWLRTIPLSGGNAIKGLKQYLETEQTTFFRFFGLVTAEIQSEQKN